MTERTDDASGAIRGRSLWGDAVLRLQANRAAMASLLILALITLVCLLGPWLSPHGYDQVYRDYVKVPASLDAYPRAEAVQPALERALRRARADIEGWRIEGGRLRVTLVAQRPIDPRIARYLDRADFAAGGRSRANTIKRSCTRSSTRSRSR